MEGMRTIKKYIAFMDLLGTKAMAIADSNQYRKIIKKFHNVTKKLCIKYKTIQVYVFSDCAYFEEAEFEKLCMFFKEMREALLDEEICFNAAICSGKLKARKEELKDDKYSIIDFLNDEVVTVYSMQSCFTGAGIYIDPNILNSKSVCNVADKILVDSIYANISKSDNKLIFKQCKDIKFQRNAEEFLQFILNLYVKNYLLDRRAARYYYTIYTTYINEQDIDSFLENDMKAIKLIINSIQKLCDFDGKIIIILILINKLYNGMKHNCKDNDVAEINEELYNPLSYIYENFHMEKIFNIRDISNKVISDTNKLLLVDFLIKKTNE